MAEVPLDLDGVFVDRNCLSWYEGSFVLLCVWLGKPLWLRHGHGGRGAALVELATCGYYSVAVLANAQVQACPRGRHVMS